jgi:hypothetical protein
LRERIALRSVLAASAVLLLAGCLGDAPPDPASAPLEVVVRSSQLPDEPCLLNREEVAAGDHEVTVFDESGETGTVVLRDPTGAVVFETAAAGSQAAQGSVTLAAGEHVVQCLSGGTLLGEVRLQVVAAGS